MEEKPVLEKGVYLSFEEAMPGLILAFGMGILVVATFVCGVAVLVFDVHQVYQIVIKEEPWRIAFILLASGAYAFLTKLIWRLANRFGVCFMAFVYSKVMGKKL